MILSAQSIRRRCQVREPMITPFHERTVECGMTFGLSAAGYDVRLAQGLVIPPHSGVLASIMERLVVPDDIMVEIADKSTWARRFVFVQNSKAEPGWRGFLTLEITNDGGDVVEIVPGTPIAHLIFHRLDEPTEQPYAGKYQDQGPVPTAAALDTVREG